MSGGSKIMNCLILLEKCVGRNFYIYSYQFLQIFAHRRLLVYLAAIQSQNKIESVQKVENLIDIDYSQNDFGLWRRDL